MFESARGYLCQLRVQVPRGDPHSCQGPHGLYRPVAARSVVRLACDGRHRHQRPIGVFDAEAWPSPAGSRARFQHINTLGIGCCLPGDRRSAVPNIYYPKGRKSQGFGHHSTFFQAQRFYLSSEARYWSRCSPRSRRDFVASGRSCARRRSRSACEPLHSW